jgi:hypothetical protein
VSIWRQLALVLSAPQAMSPAAAIVTEPASLVVGELVEFAG